MEKTKNVLGKFLIKLGEWISGKEVVKKRTSKGNLAEEIFLPPQYQKYFEIAQIREKTKEWQIECREKAELVPPELKNKKYKKNGYTGKIEITHFPLMGKPLYLQFYRRKWKELETGKIYTNTYEMHPKGMKSTKEFGDFLKELTRQERSEFHRTYGNIRLT